MFHVTLFMECIFFQFIRFARVCIHEDFNARNKCVTAKLSVS